MTEVGLDFALLSMFLLLFLCACAHVWVCMSACVFVCTPSCSVHFCMCVYLYRACVYVSMISLPSDSDESLLMVCDTGHQSFIIFSNNSQALSRYCQACSREALRGLKPAPTSGFSNVCCFLKQRLSTKKCLTQL